MDFTSRVDSLASNAQMLRSWMMSSGKSLKFVLAFQSRVSLMGMISVFMERKRLVGIVSDEATALHYVKLQRPGMLLCGSQLDDGDGYSLVARAKDLHPELRVVMILNEAYPDVERAIALKAEVICLDQELMGPESTLAIGMLTAFQGKHHVSPLAQQHLKRELSATESDANSMLSAREKEILEFMVNGFSDRAIAEQLKLSFHTVRDYNKAIRTKLGVKSKVQLASMMLRDSLGLSP